jgi:hypothetical protein
VSFRALDLDHKAPWLRPFATSRSNDFALELFTHGAATPVLPELPTVAGQVQARKTRILTCLTTTDRNASICGRTRV